MASTNLCLYIYINIIFHQQVRKTNLIPMSSSFKTHYNPVEVYETNNVDNPVVEGNINTEEHPITPSPRKKRKKFVDTTKKLSNTNSMYGALCKRGFALLFCEAGNPATAKNYLNPGSHRKAWSMQFDKGKTKFFIECFYMHFIPFILC